MAMMVIEITLGTFTARMLLLSKDHLGNKSAARPLGTPLI